MSVLDYSWKVAAAWVAVIIGISTNTEDILALSKRGRTTWQRYGVPFILVLRGALESYYQIEHVLENDTVGLRSYQESLLVECNMIAVAAAIVASVTITTYQFPEIMTMHWTITAAFTFSLVASLFCVYGACTLQRRISNLPTGHEFRVWLSTPIDPSQLHMSTLDNFEPQRANVATVLTLTAPKTLLDHSIRFFLAGLVGYLVSIHGISQVSNADGQPGVYISGSGSLGSRNTIIVCAFALCIGISLLISPSSYKNFNLMVANRAVLHGHGDAGLIKNSRRVGDGKSHEKTETLSQAQQWPTPSTDLVHALRNAVHAHERYAMAAKEVAAAEDRVAELYRILANQS